LITGKEMWLARQAIQLSFYNNPLLTNRIVGEIYLPETEKLLDGLNIYGVHNG
jgi:hypothetical protein